MHRIKKKVVDYRSSKFKKYPSGSYYKILLGFIYHEKNNLPQLMEQITELID